MLIFIRSIAVPRHIMSIREEQENKKLEEVLSSIYPVCSFAPLNALLSTVITKNFT